MKLIHSVKNFAKNYIQKIKLATGKRFSIPRADLLETAVSALSHFEKAIFWLLIAILMISTLNIFSKLNNSILIEVEAKGGNFTEGIVGFPRFINPILALSDADRDLVSLIYSGLLKATPDGDIIEDLAESYTVSENGLVYEFTIKENAIFHDGVKVTTDDIVFTINKIIDPTLKSALRANWDGVLVEKIDDRTIRFTLARPYAPFLQNTTIGILPKHIWNNIGPYKINKVKKNSSGIHEMYVLDAFKEYAIKAPLIDKITLRFYQNEDEMISSFNKNVIDSMNSISPEAITKISASRIEKTPLPRIFAVFFNQNTAQIFSNIEVRKALNIAIDKNKIVENVLTGYGTSIDSPLPPESINRPENTNQTEETTNRIEEARSILSRNGWKFDEEVGVWISKDKEPLKFSISTSNVPELKAVSSILEQIWEEVGADVDVKIFEAGNLNQNVIRPRKYEALLFGEVIGRELDLFAFWHSSQRNDPGLNIALYANITSDSLLEKGRIYLDTDLRDETYLKFEEEIKKDVPAIFLYSPDFIYIIPEYIKGISLGSVTTSGDRFLNVHEWYIKTDKVWSIFSK
jgi:peptide/nickel transport system substrate-binding protein